MKALNTLARVLSIGAILGVGGLAFAAPTSGSPLAEQEPQTMTWKGTLNTPGTKLRLEIDITENDGELTGELRSLDQNNARLDLAEIRVESDSLSFSIPGIGASFTGEYANDRAVAQGTFSQGGAQLPLTLTKSGSGSDSAESSPKGQLREAWLGELELGLQKPMMQFRIVELESGGTTAYFDSVTEGRTGFEATWSIEGDTLSFDVAAIRLTFRGVLNDSRDQAEGTWSQGGRDVPLTLTKQPAEYETANAWENRPQRPVGPFPYDAEEVRFENTVDGVMLAGTLTIPQQPGRHPVVVLISGSGAQDRDETLMEHKPFLVLADYLTRRGIAVLRYDDRGTAESTGQFGAATTEDFARDASAAVDFLRHHDRINPKEIGLAGHSEGGLVAPMVVGLRDDVAFVVLLAATGVDGATINASQTEALLRAAGTDETEIEIALMISGAAIDAALKAGPGSDILADLEPVIDQVLQRIPEAAREEATENIRQGIRNSVGRLQSDWMQFFLAYDPRPALRDIDCPVLAIIGSKDLQVLPDLNMPEIRHALTAGGNEDFEMIELEGLNHLFQQSETGSMNEYVEIQETFNPVALERIGDWIIDHVTPIT